MLKGGSEWKDSATGVQLVWIPPGTFIMGSPTDERAHYDDEQQPRVTISRGFWMGKYPVTQGQWLDVMGTNPSIINGDDLPVEDVSWDDAQAFIGKLNTAVGSSAYRLPTEAEWEYACRAGTTGERYGDLDSIAWYDGNSGDTAHPVDRKQPNAWGLYDMLGNVWEMCQDRYGGYTQGPATDPSGPTSGEGRVLRGGSWGSIGLNCSSALRSSGTPVVRYRGFGFRVARSSP